MINIYVLYVYNLAEISKKNAKVEIEKNNILYRRQWHIHQKYTKNDTENKYAQIISYMQKKYNKISHSLY